MKVSEILAIVGSSGAGKSTLFNLIPRLYDVIGGEIKLGDYNIQDLDLHFLRQNIGMVTQETYLFNVSIRENLLYAKSDATEELIQACKEANNPDFITSLPDGYDTKIISTCLYYQITKRNDDMSDKIDNKDINRGNELVTTLLSNRILKIDRKEFLYQLFKEEPGIEKTLENGPLKLLMRNKLLP